KKTRFCCFVVSGIIGQLAADRIALFQRIDSWKRVHSAGRLLNNVNSLAPRGVEFLHWISKFRYMICLENTKEPNYITEKPFQPWFAGTVPIYDGGCVEQLNQGAIVSLASVSSADVLSQLAALEADADLYEAKRHADLCDPPL